MSRPKVMVCQPVYGDVPFEAARAMTQMIARATAENLVVGVGYSAYGVLSQARNLIIKEALNIPIVTHVLLIDSDMVPPSDTIGRLLAHNLPIVSAMYYMRSPPHYPVVTDVLPAPSVVSSTPAASEHAFVKDYPKNTLLKAAGIGMGCVLIKREVFEEMQDKHHDIKWFSFENNEGEDFWFCRRAAEMGVPIRVDTGLVCGHVATTVITEEDYLRFKRPVV